MPSIAFRRQVLESVDSSNNVVKQALETGEPEGLAVQARVQTGGYGRQGRGWASPLGGMYMSLLLRPQVPPAQLPTLSLITGLAVRDALRSLVLAEEARCIVVKWPNDVVYDESARRSVQPCSAPGNGNGERLSASKLDKTTLRKLCGISLESHAGGICIGIGVNVLPPSPSIGARASSMAVAGNRPLYLAELGYGHTCQQQEAVDAVAEAVLAAFERRYGQWQAEGFAPFAKDFAEGDPLRGKLVAMVDVEGRPLAEGAAAGVDECGNLILETSDGMQVVSFGEAHLV